MGIVLKNVNITGGKLSADFQNKKTGWTRNPDWLPLPDISNTTGKLVGLFLVYEDEIDNSLRFVSHPNNNYTVDWGDGSAIDTSVSGAIQYIYNYSTLSSPISVDEQGRNYKQVIFEVTVILFQFPGQAFRVFNGTTPSKGYSVVDMYSTLPNLVGNNNLPILERLIQTNISTTVTNNLSGFYEGVNYPNLRIFELSPVIHNFAQNCFAGFGIVEQMDINFLTSTATMNQLFSDSRIKRIKLISNGTIATTLCTNSVLLFDCEVDAPNATTYNNAWINCRNLRRLIVKGMSNVTSFTTPFSNSTLLEEMELQGLTIGFSIVNARMTATALNNLMTSLGTASGSQTLNFRGNPGAATCDTTIATSKGFTVTII